MGNIQLNSQSSRPAKGLGIHTETLTVRTVRITIFCVVAHTIFFYFPFCKIVWGNYLPRFNIWASSWENLRTACANNKGADKPAHPRNLINAFVIRYLLLWKYHYLDCCMPEFVVFETEQASFCLTLSETPPPPPPPPSTHTPFPPPPPLPHPLPHKTGFLVTKPIY